MAHKASCPSCELSQLRTMHSPATVFESIHLWLALSILCSGEVGGAGTGRGRADARASGWGISGKLGTVGRSTNSCVKWRTGRVRARCCALPQIVKWIATRCQFKQRTNSSCSQRFLPTIQPTPMMPSHSLMLPSHSCCHCTHSCCQRTHAAIPLILPSHLDDAPAATAWWCCMVR